MSALRDLIDPVKNRQKNLNNPIEVIADSYRIIFTLVLYITGVSILSNFYYQMGYF